MLFVNKFCLQSKDYNKKHEIHSFVFRSGCLFNINPTTFSCSKSTVRTKCEIYSQLTIKTPQRQLEQSMKYVHN